MKPLFAAYVTSNGKEWDYPLCVERSVKECKMKFYEWYKIVDHTNISVRYAPVTVHEVKE